MKILLPTQCLATQCLATRFGVAWDRYLDAVHNLGGAGSGAAVGCGALALLLGLIFISPVGALLIKTLGWLVTILGVLMIMMGIVVWISESRHHGG